MVILLQLFTSALTILSVHLAGNGDRRFNLIGLFNQALWVLVILQSQTYGILLLTGAMVITYGNNIRKSYFNRNKVTVLNG